jgi:hypothetical protein
MQSSIWTQCGGASELRPLRLTARRVVESQHQVSTRKLVDTLEEQAVLEDLIESAKPPMPAGRRLHYLLATPFRYPPLRRGSRYGGRHERGIWYGSETLRAALAEVAYYRFVFLAGTRAELGTVTTQLTAFTVRVRTERGADLDVPPFTAHRAALASPVSWAATQPVGSAMRGAGVEVFRYPSARSPGTHVGVFTPAAFGSARPRGFETWHCTATAARVELVRLDYVERAAHIFERGQFLVDGALPQPGLSPGGVPAGG